MLSADKEINRQIKQIIADITRAFFNSAIYCNSVANKFVTMNETFTGQNEQNLADRVDLSADRVAIGRYSSYRQKCRYRKSIADTYMQIYLHVYLQIVYADNYIGLPLIQITLK